jgi:hypothetical protein
MKRFRDLKRFLMGGEAESYQNVEIHYVKGMHKTLLRIYYDNAEVDQVELSALATMEEMHQVFVEKGFVLKSPEEVTRIRKEKGAALDALYRGAEEDYMNHLLKVERLMQEEEESSARQKKTAETTKTAEAVKTKVGAIKLDTPPSNRLFVILFGVFVVLFGTGLVFKIGSATSAGGENPHAGERTKKGSTSSKES